MTRGTPHHHANPRPWRAAGRRGRLPAGAAVAVAVVASLATAGAAPAAVPPTQGEDLPHVLLVATGGTIASRAASPEQLGGYRVADTGDDLVGAVPALADVARITIEQFSNKPSTAVTPEDWVAMSRLINEALAPDGPYGEVDGVVVTHGTDALEETAYFLHLTVRSDRPVVVVGAMRPASAISADGPLNLLSAVRVAAHPASRGRGALVVLNQEINSARDVTKTNTSSVQTFQAREYGLLGIVDGDEVLYRRSLERRHTQQSEFDVAGIDAANLPRVDVIYEYAGGDGTEVDAFVAAGARGIVVAGAGRGGAAPGQSAALRRAVEEGVFVARSSRTGSGRTGGGGRPRSTSVGAGDLNPQKARILLMLALTVTSDPVEVQRIFDAY